MSLLLLPTYISCTYMLATPLRASAPAGSALPSYPRPSLLPTALRQTAKANPSYMVSIEDLSLLAQASQQQALEYSLALATVPLFVRLPAIVTSAIVAVCTPLLLFRFAPKAMYGLGFVRGRWSTAIYYVKGFARELRAAGPMRTADTLLGKDTAAPPQLQSAPVPSLADVLPARRRRASDEWATVEERVRIAQTSTATIYMKQLQRQGGLNEKARAAKARAAPVTAAHREIM